MAPSCMLTGVRKAVADYRELADDSEVDIVYVSNLHPDHKDTTILMLKHGKHVLCEKPLAVSQLPLHQALQCPYIMSHEFQVLYLSVGWSLAGCIKLWAQSLLLALCTYRYTRFHSKTAVAMLSRSQTDKSVPSSNLLCYAVQSARTMT